MSFRNRLFLFFVAIVIVPMLSVAFVLFSLIEDNENGKADAGLASRQQLAVNLYTDAAREAGGLAARVAGDRRLATALRRGDDTAAGERGRALLRRLGLVRIRIEDRRGARVDVGDRAAIAPARRDLVDGTGARFGRLVVSDRIAAAYAREVRRLTGAQTVVRAGGRSLATTLRGVPDRTLPRVGDLTIDGDDYRVASFAGPGFGGAEVQIGLLSARRAVQSQIGSRRLIAAGVLAGFLLLAIWCAVLVSRSLQAQIGSFLDAARRLGRGDFSAKVPTEGRDEFAALGGEFNRMAGELEHRLEEVRMQRLRLEQAMRRQGEAFASNLDRGAIVEIAVRTAVDGVVADGGRATLLADGSETASTGDVSGLEAIVGQAEAEAQAALEPCEVTTEDGSALAHPLRAAGAGTMLGVVSVWRRPGRPFDEADRDLFHYLAGQAAVSLDNVALHETVQRQAVTDELTGLFNHRRFQSDLVNEVERARRFDQALGLVMLDIDDFKQVNDTYGHQLGDVVLAEVARILRDVSREIDVPARYGGEELALLLPGTDLEGAYNAAERVRVGIAELEISLDGRGRVHVTASAGAASMPECARDGSSLIAAADTALYVAKRAGKNRTARAETEHARPSQ